MVSLPICEAEVFNEREERGSSVAHILPYNLFNFEKINMNNKKFLEKSLSNKSEYT